MRASLLSFLLLALSTIAGATGPRSPADLQRDAREKPAEVLAFAGIKQGMQVADVFGGAGYYSELLAAEVGEEGAVVLVNNPPYAQYAREGLAARFGNGRLPGIERLEVPNEALGLGQARFDAILMVMAFHDLYWVAPEQGWPAVDTDGFIAQLSAALKPGGVLLIVDHAAPPGTGREAVNALHRIDADFVRGEIERAGLRFEEESDLLRNPQDARTVNVFDEAIKGRTDRFVQRYRKPASP